MTPAQLRHARSIARHLRQYAQPFVLQMAGLEEIREQDWQGVSAETLQKRFQDEVHYLVKELDGVLNDMLDDLVRQ